MLFPEELGGLGLDHVAFAIIAEEIAAADASTGLIYVMHVSAAQTIFLFGTDDQRERWVGSGLLVAQKQFRRITGYKQIPALIRELETLAPSKKAVVKARKAS